MIVREKKNTTATLGLPTGFGGADSPIYRIQTPVDYLPRENTVFDLAAAKTACALSLSASDDASIRSNLNALGYGDIVLSENRGSAGLYIASRERDDILHTAIVIKSTENEEWYSNFDIGYSAEHKGFSGAADFAELSLGDYIFTRAIGTEPRFFVTGYSRGGAVANILAKRLCERYGTDSVTAYTVASPNVTISRRTGQFSGIFNLVRDEDFFTRIPPESWGYSRYGRDIHLKTDDGFVDRCREITGEEYIGFTRCAPIDSFLCSLTGLAPNVHAYYKRRRKVGGRKLSLYEFMTSAADMLSDNMNDDDADVFMSAILSDYADLLNFMSSGADLNELITSSGGIPRCSVADSHGPAAYIAALEGYRL